MREIKFKAKRVDNDEWAFFSNILQVNEGKKIVGFYESFWYNKSEGVHGGKFIQVHPETVCQFIGLQDMNGVDIYEGDIVKWDDCSKGKYWRIAVVEIDPDIQFNCLPFQEYKGIKNSSNHCFNYGNFAYKKTENYLEIIGNINDKN